MPVTFDWYFLMGVHLGLQHFLDRLGEQILQGILSVLSGHQLVLLNKGSPLLILPQSHCVLSTFLLILF